MNKSLIILFLLILNSCKETESFLDGNTFYFENTQPVNDSELNKIPNKFLGVFMSEESLFLRIDNKYIIEEYFNKTKIAASALDSIKNEYIIKDNQIFFKKDSSLLKFRKLKDSIEIIFDSNRDTLFSFNANQKIKRFNGHLILNEKEHNYWKISFLSINKSFVSLKQIYSDEDLKKMDSITKMKSKSVDSYTFIITPTRNEFKKFLELKQFGFEKIYKKVK